MRYPYPTVPRLLGMSPVEATRRLRRSGLRVGFAAPTGPGDIVVAQAPRAGTSTTVYHVIWLTLGGD